MKVRDQGQNQDSSSLCRFDFAPQITRGCRSDDPQVHRNNWPQFHSCNGAPRLKRSLRALLSGNSTFHWNHVTRLYLCITPLPPPPPTPVHTARHAFHPILHVWVMKYTSFLLTQRLPIFISLLPSALVFKPPEKTFPFNRNFESTSCVTPTEIKSTSSCAVNRQALVYWRNSPTLNTAVAWPSVTLLWSRWPSITQPPPDKLLKTPASATFTVIQGGGWCLGPSVSSQTIPLVNSQFYSSYQCLLCAHI